MYNINEVENLFHDFFHWNRARIRCIVPLLSGMIQLGTVNLSKSAATFPGTAQSASHDKSLQRLFRQVPVELDQMARLIARLIPLLTVQIDAGSHHLAVR